MKKFLTILALFFGFITQSHAESINEIQIEGLSVGDSLLKYMTEENIYSSKRNYVKNRKYYVVGYDNNLKIYNTVDVYLKKGDKKYIIKTVSGSRPMNYKTCLTKKRDLINDIQKYFPNIKTVSGKSSHSYDKSGKSIQDQTAFLLKNDRMNDHVRVECTDWSKKFEKKNWSDNLSVAVYSKEILKWFEGGYK